MVTQHMKGKDTQKGETCVSGLVWERYFLVSQCNVPAKNLWICFLCLELVPMTCMHVHKTDACMYTYDSFQHLQSFEAAVFSLWAL